jgi:hypothetical protein
MCGIAMGAITAVTPAWADEEAKHGGILTYMIPADAPPSFDGHRETTYATVHSTAPFYSVLIRLDPEHPEDGRSSSRSAPGAAADRQRHPSRSRSCRGDGTTARR